MNKNKIFEELPLIKEVILRGTKHPEVFYIGKGKTGSASIFKGITDKSICHWHGTQYYERIHNTNILSQNNLTIYDYIEWVDQNIHPVFVIECYRDPISQFVSSLFQWFGSLNIDKVNQILHDFFPKITFQKELEKPNSYLNVIYLKTENSSNWENELEKYNIHYKNNIANKQTSLKYHQIKSLIKLPKWKLDLIYSDNKITKLYTKEEIKKFYEKWQY